MVPFPCFKPALIVMHCFGKMHIIDKCNLMINNQATRGQYYKAGFLTYLDNFLDLRYCGSNGFYLHSLAFSSGYLKSVKLSD